ncbi:hypothetical protein BAUCODRAFT_448966 [Baudoinia panamericana UAMH 10762]|uniref:Uncharacterized protein n=1 Tax=Baudoinia panamericana (strain UAMH 10762) TaxID=717646 RepID=M2NDQ6_BAUPA|nr:uncharacterized protein BAUCODRAFT_448966 [Baudoinia panamericana UAMH 10762]EMC97354.1 hypothetical protein BAUCODRAFT_448966 [Baudoinia panamericana UAMH 10762]
MKQNNVPHRSREGRPAGGTKTVSPKRTMAARLMKYLTPLLPKPTPRGTTAAWLTIMRRLPPPMERTLMAVEWEVLRPAERDEEKGRCLYGSRASHLTKTGSSYRRSSPDDQQEGVDSPFDM